MPYASDADVERAVGGAANLVALADYDADGAADASVLAAAVAEADALIDTYASKRFAVPFVPAPPAIVALSARLAARVLRRNRGTTLAADVEAEKTDERWLTALSKGEVLPGVEPLPASGEIVVDSSGPRESTKAVSRERMKGFW